MLFRIGSVAAAALLSLSLSGCLLAAEPIIAGGVGLYAAHKINQNAKQEQNDQEAQYRTAAATALNVKPTDIGEVFVSAAGATKEWQVKVGKTNTLYYCTGTGNPVHDATCKPG